ncbi:MAG: tetratricopeptide repeat protein, partial [Blastocatellia bacterium]
MAIYLEDRQHEVGGAALHKANQGGGADVASEQEAERLWSLSVDKLAAGDMEGALAEAEKSLLIYESTDNFFGQANCQKLLGRIYEKQGLHEKAAQFYEAALRNYEKDGNQDGVGLT